MAVGLEVRVPFCDHRLVEYVFNAPWSMKTFDGREKSLLRAATRDVLPRSVVERLKSPYPSTQDPRYEKALCDEMAKLLASEGVPILPLLDTDRVEAVLDEPVPSMSNNITSPRAGMEMALQFNAWLKKYQVCISMEGATAPA